MRRSTSKFVFTALACGVAFSALRASTARAGVIVSNQSTGTGYVAEYPYAGSTNSSGQSGFINNVGQPAGVALDGATVLVTNKNNGTVGQYQYGTGAAINSSFITGLGSPDQLAVAGSTVYVSDPGRGTVGAYTTSGAAINASLISGLNSPTGIAVWGNDLYVASSTDGTIAKYTTAGVLENPALITGLSQPEGIAISGSDLYVANRGTPRTIGKYTTSGGTTNAAFIPSSSLGFGGNTPHSIAVAGSNLYITSTGVGGSALSKFKTSGSLVSANLVPQASLSFPFGVAIQRTVADLQNTADTSPSGSVQTLDNQAIVTAILSQPGTVNGYTNTAYAFLLQDRTGSLQVYSPMTTAGYTPAVGDEINITGTYSQSVPTAFGMPEISNVTEVNRISTGNAVADPVVATIADLNHYPMPLGAPALPAVGEYLFTLKDVTITGESSPIWGHGATGAAGNENMTITDANGKSMVMFYWPNSYLADAALWGQTIPTGPVDMTGIVHTFGSTPEFTPISITPLPEPGSLTLVLSIAGFFTINRRRSHCADRGRDD